MAIDKSLSQAPLGIDQLNPEEMGDEPALEIEIEDPESVTIGIDGQPLLTIEETEDEENYYDNFQRYARLNPHLSRREMKQAMSYFEPKHGSLKFL
jgi:hypothetical protein